MIGPQAQRSTQTDVREVQARMVGKAGITEKKKKTETARRRSRRRFRTRRSKREKSSRKSLRRNGTGVECKLAEVNIVGKRRRSFLMARKMRVQEAVQIETSRPYHGRRSPGPRRGDKEKWNWKWHRSKEFRHEQESAHGERNTEPENLRLDQREEHIKA